MKNTNTVLGRIDEKIKNLPLVDVSVSEVISLLDDPGSNFEQIAEKLSPDIAASFLKMANSVYSGREVRSVSYAVRVLGYSQMEKILKSAVLMDHLVRHLDLVNFSFKKFQAQAHFCAAVAKVLGEILGFEQPEDLFTVAMLQNIGKLLTAVYFEDEFKKINELKMSECISTREAEQRVMGATHGEIGASTLDKFKIPKDICEAIRLHDMEEPVVSDRSNFQLVFISKQAFKIVADFSLPEGMDAREILDRLEGTVKEGRKRYQEEARAGMQTKGFGEIFATLLEQASILVKRDMKIFVKQRWETCLPR